MGARQPTNIQPNVYCYSTSGIQSLNKGKKYKIRRTMTSLKHSSFSCVLSTKGLFSMYMLSYQIVTNMTPAIFSGKSFAWSAVIQIMRRTKNMMAYLIVDQ